MPNKILYLILVLRPVQFEQVLLSSLDAIEMACLLHNNHQKSPQPSVLAI